jgi:serine/threonine protein kinase
LLAFEVNDPRVVDDKYALEELIGLGSMGEVWLARHVGLGQPCAVKLMSRDDNEDARAAFVRFAREARVAAALSQKTRHIVRVTDYGVDAVGQYLVMELLEGEALSSLIPRGCAPGEAVEIVAQMATTLAVAHKEGVVHRDLKPANVFLTRTEDGALLVKLLDFGIARLLLASALTLKGVTVGTPAYMSPEHVMGDAIDARADVWSLAVVAFELVTGTSPFGADSVDATLRKIIAFDPAPAPEKLAAFFRRAFARDIDARFQNAQELARAFAVAVAGRAPRRSWLHTRAPLVAAACSATITIIAAILARAFL